MGELIGGIAMLIAILAAVAAYLGALAAYAVFVAPFVVAGAALFYGGALVRDYCVAVRGVMFLRTPRFQLIPPYRPQDEPASSPAYRQYFFGPAMRDLRQVVVIAWRACRDRAHDFGAWVLRRFMIARGADGLATFPAGVTLWLGLGVGCLVAGALLVVTAAVHAITVVMVQALARMAIFALRMIDTAVLRVKGINGMICPACYARIVYPAYQCPNCSRLHGDVRPGRYGVFRRRCQCQHKLPTLLMVGSYRMPAMCTNRDCGRQMSDETGRFAEFVLPLFGGTGAGKTRLMAAMIMSLHESARDDQTSVRLADDETRHSYEVLREILATSGYTLGTSAQLPRAHSVLITIGRFKRLLHIFDAFGERFVDADRTDELRYLSAARTYLFVLDPMSLPTFWSQLTTQERDGLDRMLASGMPPATVFDQSVQTMIGMRAKVGRSRLAVAISKTDVIAHLGLLDGRQDDSAWAERWLVETLGQRNMVQAMHNEFRELRFFFTSAVMADEDHIDPSVHPVVAWCLRDESSRQAVGPLLTSVSGRLPARRPG
jgi:hypothetical protein